jgi:transposase
MAAPLALRMDFSAAQLHRFARQSRNANQARRLLALAMIYDGGSRRDAARIGGVGLQIVRDWVIRFNVDGLEGLSIVRLRVLCRALTKNNGARSKRWLKTAQIRRCMAWFAGV